MQLEGEVQMQKANVRNEEDRVKMEKERNNERNKKRFQASRRPLLRRLCAAPVSCHGAPGRCHIRRPCTRALRRPRHSVNRWPV